MASVWIALVYPSPSEYRIAVSNSCFAAFASTERSPIESVGIISEKMSNVMKKLCGLFSLVLPALVFNSGQLPEHHSGMLPRFHRNPKCLADETTDASEFDA